MFSFKRSLGHVCHACICTNMPLSWFMFFLNEARHTRWAFSAWFCIDVKLAFQCVRLDQLNKYPLPNFVITCTLHDIIVYASCHVNISIYDIWSEIHWSVCAILWVCTGKMRGGFTDRSLTSWTCILFGCFFLSPHHATVTISTYYM